MIDIKLFLGDSLNLMLLHFHCRYLRLILSGTVKTLGFLVMAVMVELPVGSADLLDKIMLQVWEEEGVYPKASPGMTFHPKMALERKDWMTFSCFILRL